MRTQISQVAIFDDPFFQLEPQTSCVPMMYNPMAINLQTSFCVGKSTEAML